VYALNDLTDSNYDAAPEYSVPVAGEKARRLRSARKQLAVMRHELLVSLRVVNSVEKEVVDGEWMNWLGEELHRCDNAAHFIANATDEELKHRAEHIEKLKDYCRDCNQVWRDVKRRFTELS
jgi:uncharacterized protein CbrC (UPF0167 family)